jgi:ABC-type Co2+ transport system permease subunit
MNVILILVFVVATLYGLGNFAFAKSAIHEIAAYICFMLAVIALIGYGVLDRLDDIKKLLAKKEPPRPQPAPAEETIKAIGIG